MELQERAKEILEYFKKTGHEFNSSLVKSDIIIESKDEKILFWKTKIKTINLSDKISYQIINYYRIMGYKTSLNSYLLSNSSKTQGFLMFETERSVDQEGFEDAKMLYTLCNNILNVYQNKTDTEKFDKVVSEVKDFLTNNIKREAWGDYGVVFSYVVETMPKISIENKQWLSKVNAFADKLNSNNRTKLNESGLEA